MCTPISFHSHQRAGSSLLSSIGASVHADLIFSMDLPRHLLEEEYEDIDLFTRNVIGVGELNEFEWALGRQQGLIGDEHCASCLALARERWGPDLRKLLEAQPNTFRAHIKVASGADIKPISWVTGAPSEGVDTICREHLVEATTCCFSKVRARVLPHTPQRRPVLTGAQLIAAPGR